MQFGVETSKIPIINPAFVGKNHFFADLAIKTFFFSFFWLHPRNRRIIHIFLKETLFFVIGLRIFLQRRSFFRSLQSNSREKCFCAPPPKLFMPPVTLLWRRASLGYADYIVGSLHCPICPTMAFIMSHPQGSQSRLILGWWLNMLRLSLRNSHIPVLGLSCKRLKKKRFSRYAAVCEKLLVLSRTFRKLRCATVVVCVKEALGTVAIISAHNATQKLKDSARQIN